MVVKKKTAKVEAVALDEEKLHQLIGEGQSHCRANRSVVSNRKVV